MTDTRTLRDFIELAMKRRGTTSGRRLALIAQAEGHDISHSTINRIRKGGYSRTPTTDILKAIAFLAKEPEEAVFAVAAETPEWGELEDLFLEWDATQQRLRLLTDRYARMRGLTSSAALDELNDMSQQMSRVLTGRGGWYPPWDPESQAQRDADQKGEGLRLVEFTPDSIRVDVAIPRVEEADDLEIPAARTAPRGYRKGQPDQGEPGSDDHNSDDP